MSRRKYVPVYFKTLPKEKRIKTLVTLSYKRASVPIGYQSDGLTKLVNKYRPDSLRAAIIHDFICETKCLPRKLADQYFYEILLLDGVSKFTARKYWLAVRAYALITFKK